MTTDVYTVRMGFYDSKPWTAEEIVNLYKVELKAAGFYTPQLPSILHPLTKVEIKKDDPFTGAVTATITAPPFPAITQTRDTRETFEKDPAKLASTGEAILTTFSWNLCIDVLPARVADYPGTLRELFRRVKPDIGTLKLSPRVTVWQATPAQEAGYPPRPPYPATTGAGQGPARAGAGTGILAFLAGLVGVIVAKKKGWIG